jgi:hypothetical protein
MDGYEHPTRTASVHAEYRLSWLAYIYPVRTLLLSVAVSLGIGALTFYQAPTKAVYWMGMFASVFIAIVALGICVYNILILKSIRLYTDDIGVWLYRGILPWSRGVRGVKWRDIEDAMYYTGFSSWMFSSYTVRIGHRFTKTSEIFVYNLASGHKAVEHINQLHQNILKAEQTTELALEV